jgi:MFS family permease
LDKSIYDRQYWKFSAYGFLKNLRFFDPFIVLFFLETGLNFLEIGILISFREIIINIFEIPSGLAADTFGRRKSMIISFSAYIISFIIFFTSRLFSTHLLAMFFYAVGEAFRSGTHKALILEYLKQNNILNHKVHYYGHTRSWSQMGSAVSAVIAGTIVFFSPGYRFVFLFSIIPYILGLFLIWSYPVNLDFTKNTDTNLDFNKLSYKKRMLGTLKEIITMIKGKSTRRVFINNSIFDAVFKSIKDYLQPVLLALVLGLHVLGNYSEDEKISILSAFVYFILFFITSYAAKFSGNFANLFKSDESSLNFSFIMGIVLILCIGLFLYLRISIVSVLLFIMLYIIQNIRKPVTVGVLSSRIPAIAMASGLSVESQLKTILVAVFAPVLGFMMDYWGVGLTFLILAGFLTILYPFIRIRK